MKDYNKGKIYRIVGNGYTYYGSTCEPTLARRLAKHQADYKQYIKGNRGYVTCYKCFDNGNINFSIILVENCSCNNKDELYKRERYYIENFECVNTNIPNNLNLIGRQQYKKIYRSMNYHAIHEGEKRYYLNNLTKYREEFDCCCGAHLLNFSKCKHMKTLLHTSFLDRLNSSDKDIALGAIMEMHNRPRYNLF